MINEAMMTGCGLPNNMRKKGMAPAEMTDPRDMKSHFMTIRTKRTRPQRHDKGEMAK